MRPDEADLLLKILFSMFGRLAEVKEDILKNLETHVLPEFPLKYHINETKKG